MAMHRPLGSAAHEALERGIRLETLLARLAAAPADASGAVPEPVETTPETAEQRIERFDQEFVAKFEPLDRAFEEAQAADDIEKVKTLGADYLRLIEGERQMLLREVQDAKDYSEEAINSYGADAPETQQAADALRRWTTALEQFSAWCDANGERLDVDNTLESMRKWREEESPEAKARIGAAQAQEPAKPEPEIDLSVLSPTARENYVRDKQAGKSVKTTEEYVRQQAESRAARSVEPAQPERKVLTTLEEEEASLDAAFKAGTISKDLYDRDKKAYQEARAARDRAAEQKPSRLEAKIELIKKHRELQERMRTRLKEIEAATAALETQVKEEQRQKEIDALLAKIAPK